MEGYRDFDALFDQDEEGFDESMRKELEQLAKDGNFQEQMRESAIGTCCVVAWLRPTRY